MKKKAPKPKPSALARFEKAAALAAQSPYRLRLYVSGNNPHSQRAIVNIKKICDRCLPGHYSLEIVDIHRTPEQTKGDQVVAAPTLIKLSPLPRTYLIGDLSNTEKVLKGLNLL